MISPPGIYSDTLIHQESTLNIPEELRSQFLDLHRILKALRNQDIGPALVCVLRSYCTCPSVIDLETCDTDGQGQTENFYSHALPH